MVPDDADGIQAWCQLLRLRRELRPWPCRRADGRCDQEGHRRGCLEPRGSRGDGEELQRNQRLMNGTPNSQGLNRKHLVEGTQASLGRMGLEYVDVNFCHHPDAFTPIEETVRGMNYIIEKGWAFYWGTSNWSTSEITEACEIADRLGLIRPIVEQSQYNLFERNRIDFELVDLLKKLNYGITAWSPLAFGTLTGKYSSDIPQGSRLYTDEMRNALWGTDFDERAKKADKLKPIAAELGCSLAQLALAWCVANENISTVIVGASRQSQLEENLKALDFVEKLTPTVKAQIDAIIDFVPTHPVPDHLREIRKRHL